MRKEVTKALLETTQVVQIINKCGPSIKEEIKKMLNMAWRSYSSFDVVSKIQMMEDGRKQRYQTSKYTILKNSVYYVHHN